MSAAAPRIPARLTGGLTDRGLLVAYSVRLRNAAEQLDEVTLGSPARRSPGLGRRVRPAPAEAVALSRGTRHHGAGLMLLPLLLGLPTPAHAEDVVAHALPAGRLAGASLLQDIAAVLVHTLAMLAVAALVAVVVYTRLGVGVLRRAWINLDALWAAVLVLAGVLTLFT